MSRELTFGMAMAKRHTYHVAPYQRRAGVLRPAEVIECESEDKAFQRGKAMMGRTSGLVFFKIECGEDEDVWRRIDTLATVGDVPPEADELAGP